MKSQAWALKLLRESRVAHLATSTREGRPHIAPICFALDGKSRIYSSIDKKPKHVKNQHLRRVLNIVSNPTVALVADSYSEDWNKLQYVMVDGRAKILRRGSEHQHAVNVLRRKYPQYRSMRIEQCPIIRVKPVKLVAWKSNALKR